MEPQTAVSRLVAGRRQDPGEARGLRPWTYPHGLSGLLARELEAGRIVLPDEEAQEVVEDWRAERRWAAVLSLELRRIAEAAAHLPAPILLKGPAVAHRYGDPSIRNYTDIDLLLPQDGIAPWTRALAGLGFRPPTPWMQRRARYSNHLVLRRSVGERDVLCELHWCLFVERRALRVTYEALRPYARPSTFQRVLWLDDAAQLVVLALHLAHHRVETRRLIWYRDIVEIATAEVVPEARALASQLGVTWALEQVLFDTEQLLGEPVWAASPETPRRFGTALLAETEGAGYLRPLALARELGPGQALRYVVIIFDPRRFARPGGGYDFDALWSWVKRTARGLKAIRLRRLWSRRRTP